MLCATVLTLVLLAGIAAADDLSNTGFDKGKLTLVTASGSYVFDIEIATSSEQQSRGLMFRSAIGAREGMLFIHDEPRHVAMWMRNTFIPLDMIFILPDGRIHRIEARTEPLSERNIESGEKVTGVLEIAGGMAEKLGLVPGDMVEYAHFAK